MAGEVEIASWLKTLPHAPEFHPSEAEFGDPVAYILKIEAEARHYGICKIVPPFAKASKKAVASNLCRSLAMSHEGFGSNVHGSCAPMARSMSGGLAGGAQGGKPKVPFLDAGRFDSGTRAKFTTRRQQLGWNPRRSKGMTQSQSHKLVWQSGESYTLEQFETKAKLFSRSRLGTGRDVSPLAVESLFWRAACDKPISVEYANDIPGSAFAEPTEPITGTPVRGKKRKRGLEESDQRSFDCHYVHFGGDEGFHEDEFEETDNTETGKMKTGLTDACGDSGGGVGMKLANSAWNMRNVARSPGSLLRFMPDEVPGVTSPMVYIGMLFSWFAWHVEDHELHSLNYLHMGASKTWYAVPGDAAPALEEAVRVHGYGGHLSSRAAFSLLGEKTTVMSPEVLVAAGVPCCRLVQNAGEYVVTFPRAYHLGFSHGFNCGEAANFATPGWLNVAREAAARRAAMKYLPMLSHQQLLYLLTMSLPSRMPSSSTSEPRSSRLKGKKKSMGEEMVKSVFVKDVIQNNQLIARLLDNGVSSCLLVGGLLSLASSLPQFQACTEQKLRSSVPAACDIGQTTLPDVAKRQAGWCRRPLGDRGADVFPERPLADGDCHQKISSGNLEDKVHVFCPEIQIMNSANELSEALPFVDVERRSDATATEKHAGDSPAITKSVSMDWGTLPCAACGILCYASLAVVEPSSAAAGLFITIEQDSQPTAQITLVSSSFHYPNQEGICSADVPLVSSHPEPPVIKDAVLVPEPVLNAVDTFSCKMEIPEQSHTRALTMIPKHQVAGANDELASLLLLASTYEDNSDIEDEDKMQDDTECEVAGRPDSSVSCLCGTQFDEVGLTVDAPWVLCTSESTSNVDVCHNGAYPLFTFSNLVYGPKSMDKVFVHGGVCLAVENEQQIRSNDVAMEASISDLMVEVEGSFSVDYVGQLKYRESGSNLDVDNTIKFPGTCLEVGRQTGAVVRNDTDLGAGSKDGAFGTCHFVSVVNNQSGALHKNDLNVSTENIEEITCKDATGFEVDNNNKGAGNVETSVGVDRKDGATGAIGTPLEVGSKETVTKTCSLVGVREDRAAGTGGLVNKYRVRHGLTVTRPKSSLEAYEGGSRPRILCLEHAVEAQERLKSVGGAHILLVCHTDFNDIEHRARDLAHEYGFDHTWREIPFQKPATDDISIISTAVEVDEDDDCTFSDWVTQLGLNTRHQFRESELGAWKSHVESDGRSALRTKVGRSSGAKLMAGMLGLSRKSEDHGTVLSENSNQAPLLGLNVSVKPSKKKKCTVAGRWCGRVWRVNQVHPFLGGCRKIDPSLQLGGSAASIVALDLLGDLETAKVRKITGSSRLSELSSDLRPVVARSPGDQQNTSIRQRGRKRKVSDQGSDPLLEDGDEEGRLCTSTIVAQMKLNIAAVDSKGIGDALSRPKHAAIGTVQVDDLEMEFSESTNSDRSNITLTSPEYEVDGNNKAETVGTEQCIWRDVPITCASAYHRGVDPEHFIYPSRSPARMYIACAPTDSGDSRRIDVPTSETSDLRAGTEWESFANFGTKSLSPFKIREPFYGQITDALPVEVSAVGYSHLSPLKDILGEDGGNELSRRSGTDATDDLILGLKRKLDWFVPSPVNKKAKLVASDAKFSNYEDSSQAVSSELEPQNQQTIEGGESSGKTQYAVCCQQDSLVVHKVIVQHSMLESSHLYSSNQILPQDSGQEFRGHTQLCFGGRERSSNDEMDNLLDLLHGPHVCTDNDESILSPPQKVTCNQVTVEDGGPVHGASDLKEASLELQLDNVLSLSTASIGKPGAKPRGRRTRNVGAWKNHLQVTSETSIQKASETIINLQKVSKLKAAKLGVDQSGQCAETLIIVDGCEQELDKLNQPNGSAGIAAGGPSTRLRARVTVGDKEAGHEPCTQVEVVTGKSKIKGKPKKKKTVTTPVRRASKEEEGEFQCDLDCCRMSFGTEGELQMHKRNRCTFKGCGKRFFMHKYLLQHRRVHLDERPLKCPWKGCKQAFKWAWARTEHIRVHTGERPYSCPECQQTFRFVSDYSRHKRNTGHTKS